MSTLFISDLHLEEARPDITQALLRLLSLEAWQADALYILGDLFEAWIGDDDRSALTETVAGALHGIADAGVPIWFLHGNRDFLLGENYAQRCGMQLLPETIVVDLYDTPTLLLHGDTLCTADTAYLQFRAQVRQPEWQSAFLSQSIDARRAFAANARAQSRQHTQSTSMAIMDVSADAVAEAFRMHGVSRLIHGHTHRPAIHPIESIDGRDCQRVVLGDWHQQGSVLRVDADGIELATLPFRTES